MILLQYTCGCGRTAIPSGNYCTSERNSGVLVELQTTGDITHHYTSTKEGEDKPAVHPPAYPAPYGTLILGGAHIINQRHGCHKPSEKANGSTAGYIGECLEGLCPHESPGEAKICITVGGWLWQGRTTVFNGHRQKDCQFGCGRSCVKSPSPNDTGHWGILSL